jgi:hypothetical protein
LESDSEGDSDSDSDDEYAPQAIAVTRWLHSY